MSNDIPLRAKQKACDLANDEGGMIGFYDLDDIGASPPLRALARNIAETQAADEEEALKALAREIVAEALEETGCVEAARNYRSGKEDDYFKRPSTTLSLTLAGIKAGIKHEQERGE